MTQLVLLRHGESISNRDRCFTGWSNAPLTPLGEREAEQAGRLLKKAGHKFDICSPLNSGARMTPSTLCYQSWDRMNRWCNGRHYGLWKEPIAGRQSGNTGSALFSVLNSA
ncbi:MAG TPA: histidine phosphatase family protein, partial [Nitrosospira sp.]|nr:histidine phosphatase family protein [Nitrosospira sp.]